MTPRELADLCERAPGFDADRTQAEEIKSLRAEMAAIAVVVGRSKADGFDVDWFELARDVREQADEIARLKAEAIVAGSIKLDVAVKTALERERLGAEIDALRSEAILRAMQIKNLMAEIQRLKAAWVRITDGRGWLGCVEAHDMRCPMASVPPVEEVCTCGADDFRRLMEK